jgi:5-methylcytosine-specific restriction endonuclease McrA
MLARRRVLHRSPFVEKPVEAGSRRWLVAELDRLTSLIVRRRDRRCVTCGGRRTLQCSHFYSRRHLATRFDLRNCNAMCLDCNRRHNSDPTPYLRFMNERYGPEVVAELDGMRAETRKVGDEELVETLARLKRIL